MATSKRGLGKGLGALIPQNSVFTGGRTIVNINIDSVVPNPRQPRTTFPEGSLEDLAASIKAQGVAQPILVRMKNNKYELVAGERRLRAAKQAGLNVIPAIIKSFTDQESLEIALIENLQREDLNPMDEAEAYALLSKEFNLTQAQIAEKVGKKRTTVTNMMRLLGLPKEVKDSLRKGVISVGHARPLAALGEEDKQKFFFEEIIRRNLSVRDVELLIYGPTKTDKKRVVKKYKSLLSPELIEILEELTSYLGTKVHLMGNEEKGKIEISYFSKEDLERVIDLILGKPEELVMEDGTSMSHGAHTEESPEATVH
ncbi:MAG: ParB/RepB/Spo0J family partition protein [Candidatus Saganbacteria bacterium]|nr:ParB/RepB/Spo0J family partition protein [Candidatus Saganbacteria bacterium]